MYFTAAENSDVDAISSASVTVVDGVAKGNVRAVADMIHEYTGGDLYSIQTSVRYPGNGNKLIMLVKNKTMMRDRNCPAILRVLNSMMWFLLVIPHDGMIFLK